MMSVGLAVQGQTTEQGAKALEYENYATARSIFSKLVHQQPSNAQNYYYLGITLCNLDKFDSARTVFTAGTEADSKAINNYAGLGRVALDQNKAQEATQYFDKVKSLTSPKDVNQYLLIADAYTSAQHPNYEMAVTLLSKAKDLNNRNAEVFWLLGKTYEAMNRSGEAVKVYKVPGTMNGLNYFQLSDWQSGSGGSWENWARERVERFPNLADEDGHTNRQLFRLGWR